MSKYIFISGGVISGIGKGISAASIAFILKSYGFKVSMIKTDPYLNVDAGTMNPLEHGETFVLEDGFETDMDIGSYERFVNESFSRPNSMSCGAVLERVIQDERSLAYDGKWVSLDYHVPEVIINWIKKVAKDSDADITIVEIGGTVGEIGNSLFLEANKIMKVYNPSDVIHIHVSYLPVPSALGEMKSKTVQISTKLLNSSGICPEFLIARSKAGIDDIRREKLSRYCFVKPEHIISAPDTKCIYEIPLNFQKADIGKNILKTLNLKPKPTDLLKVWEKKVNKMKKSTKALNIGVVAKDHKSGDFDLKDSYVSVIEAINHACWEKGFQPNIQWITAEEVNRKKLIQEKILKLDGLIIPQGWGAKGVLGKMKAIQLARENKIPFLGLGYGMQIAVIEFCKNVLEIRDATSQELDKKSQNFVIHQVLDKEIKYNGGKYKDGVRLGAWPCKVKNSTLLDNLYTKYGNNLFSTYPTIMERHRHMYEFNNEYLDVVEKAGLIISGTNPEETLVEAVELDQKLHPFFIGTQYQPELKTRFLHPHPLFIGFIDACSARKKGVK
ncbi:CTP synthase [Candidatus Dojkabacteria bacterium]|uniref:CTP synthase (glutamine hydrolyzing) n=1 Tax=Candidatus Dojkabacteria bacterium TaxID=2099670 RepID=A0A847VDR8_9BACT|nr:CTP synthase [Candidatus Dojkabacteria bacterium]